MSDVFGHAEQLADAVERNGVSVVLRRLSKTPGPAPLLNPPRVEFALIEGAVLAGATMVSLRCTAAVGRLLPGDALWVNGRKLVVQAAAAARPLTGVPGFTNVAVSQVEAQIADGEAVDMTFAADLSVPAMINSFPRRLIDGERIRTRDLRLTLPANKLPDVAEGWSVVVLGREMSIVAATPSYERGVIVKWDVQAR